MKYYTNQEKQIIKSMFNDYIDNQDKYSSTSELDKKIGEKLGRSHMGIQRFRSLKGLTVKQSPKSKRDASIQTVKKSIKGLSSNYTITLDDGTTIQITKH